MPRKFKTIAAYALGTKYELDFAFIPPREMRKLNLIHRGKDEPTDILSFPFGTAKGGIYICKSEARREAPRFGRSYESFLGFLFIHGCVHLKGYDHGATMERIEAGIRRKFRV